MNSSNFLRNMLRGSKSVPPVGPCSSVREKNHTMSQKNKRVPKQLLWTQSNSKQSSDLVFCPRKKPQLFFHIFSKTCLALSKLCLPGLFFVQKALRLPTSRVPAKTDPRRWTSLDVETVDLVCCERRKTWG